MTLAFENRGDSAEVRVLVALLHEDRSRVARSGLEVLTGEQWDRLIALAGEQRVRPLLHERLRESDAWKHAPEAARQRLSAEHRQIAMLKLRMHADLATLLATLSAAKVPVIVLKGSHVGPIIYQDVTLREMNDLDVMVHRDHLELAVELTMSLGYTGLRHFNVAADASVSHHVTDLVKPGAASVEVHWNITPPGRETSVDPELLWKRARPLALPGASALGLSPDDLLLHVCFHASFHHQFEFGLRPFCDIARVIAHHQGELDWPFVTATAVERKWARGVALSLQLARDLVGAQVPESVIGRLAPGDLEATALVARRSVWVSPAEAGSSSKNMAGLVAESWGARLSAARRTVFVSKQQLFATYGIRPDTQWWPLLYVRRVLDVIRRNAGTTISVIRGGHHPEARLAQQRRTMQNWLSPVSQRHDSSDHGTTHT